MYTTDSKVYDSFTFLYSSHKCRYFSFADQSSSSEQDPTAGGTSGGSEPSGVSPSVADVLQSLLSARARGEGSEALTKILKKALQQHKKSEVNA